MRSHNKLLFAVTLLILTTHYISASEAQGQASPSFELNAPARSGFPSNSAVDVVGHNGGVWLATGKGIIYSMDDGQTWQYYDATNGLVSDDISAMFSIGGRFWTGTNHTETVLSQLVSSSDGVSYTDNSGALWNRINFNSTGQNINYVTGGNRTIFDITGAQGELLGPNNNWLFFTAFAGAFLASRDGGINWRRIYPTASDSVDFNDGTEPSLRMRYFSCAADTSHGDSLFVWSGTAEGIFLYVYVLPREKLYIKRFLNASVCNDCSTRRLLVGGDAGVAVGRVTGGPFFTRFVADGLPAAQISASVAYGGEILVGTVNPANGNSTGLALSTNEGNSYSAVTLPSVVGANRVISDFARINSRLYMAAQQGGLFASADTGTTWQSILIDSANIASVRNNVNALHALGDTLLVGTDSGFVSLFLNATGNIDSSRAFVFPEDAQTSTRVIKIATQPDENNAIWVSTRPRAGNGVPAVLVSTDRGNVWFLKAAPVTNDFGFIGDSILLATELGPRLFTSPSAITNSAFAIADSITGANTMASDTLYDILSYGDTMVVASSRSLAVSINRGKKFKLFRPNFDSLSADVVVNYTALGTLYGIPGDFIPAMAVQNRSGNRSDIWVSGRPVTSGGDGISRGRYDVNGILQWEVVYEEGFAWNFGFANDTAFAATNAGLLRFVNDVWDTIPLVDPVTNAPLVDAGTAVFAAEPINNYIWLGTSDGIVRIDRATTTNQKLFSVVDSTTSVDEVYAFPVPFSPNSGGTVDFRFHIPKDGNVTLEVYDFAMNLVARPIDNVFYSAGYYPDGGSQGRTWDGRNGKGEVVAVGIYYFKVTVDNGEARWGKVAVIP